MPGLGVVARGEHEAVTGPGEPQAGRQANPRLAPVTRMARGLELTMRARAHDGILAGASAAPRSIHGPAMSTHRFFVPGDQALTPTGLVLDPGDHVLVRHVEGSVCFNMSPEWGTDVGPNGYARSDFNVHWPADARFQDPLTGWHDGHAGLMAMVDGRPCFVGSKATLCSRMGGTLLLGINDATPDGPSDLGNTGGFEVEIVVARPDPRLAPLLGVWVKVSETPRPPGGPDLNLLAFDLDGTWRILAPYDRALVEEGTIQEAGSLGGRELVKLRRHGQQRDDIRFFEATGKQLVLERHADEVRQAFDRL